MFSLKEYESGNAIAISWHIDDVKAIDDSLNDEQARQVLANFADHHEGSMESMWDDLQYHVNNFKEDL